LNLLTSDVIYFIDVAETDHIYSLLVDPATLGSCGGGGCGIFSISAAKTNDWASVVCPPGAEIASIRSAAEHGQVRVLASTKPAQRYWVGLNDIESERTTSATGWVWNDGSTSDYYTSQWALDEPSNSGDNQDCGYLNPDPMYGDFAFADIGCTFAEYYAICQKGKKTAPIHRSFVPSSMLFPPLIDGLITTTFPSVWYQTARL
jgi:hypothetical protein